MIKKNDRGNRRLGKFCYIHAACKSRRMRSQEVNYSTSKKNLELDSYMLLFLIYKAKELS